MHGGSIDCGTCGGAGHVWVDTLRDGETVHETCEGCDGDGAARCWADRCNELASVVVDLDLYCALHAREEETNEAA